VLFLLNIVSAVVTQKKTMTIALHLQDFIKIELTIAGHYQDP
jgi:hypothetical protein